MFPSNLSTGILNKIHMPSNPVFSPVPPLPQLATFSCPTFIRPGAPTNGRVTVPLGVQQPACFPQPACFVTACAKNPVHENGCDSEVRACDQRENTDLWRSTGHGESVPVP